MGAAKEPEISRVVVTLEPEAIDPQLIASAARLARAYDAELVGLFVRLQDYLDLADLPFTQAVVATTGEIRPMDKRHMEQALDEVARRAEKGLSEQAALRQVRWSFQSIAGHLEDVVTSYTTRSDIVSLPISAAGVLRQVVEQDQPPAMLITRRGPAGNRSVVVIYDGKVATLAVGRRIAASLGEDLSVLIVSDKPESTAKYRRNVRAWMRRHQASANIVAMGEGWSLSNQLQRIKPGLVIVSRHSAAGQEIMHQVEQEEAEFPVLLVDGSRSD